MVNAACVGKWLVGKQCPHILPTVPKLPTLVRTIAYPVMPLSEELRSRSVACRPLTARMARGLTLFPISLLLVFELSMLDRQIALLTCIVLENGRFLLLGKQTGELSVLVGKQCRATTRHRLPRPRCLSVVPSPLCNVALSPCIVTVMLSLSTGLLSVGLVKVNVRFRGRVSNVRATLTELRSAVLTLLVRRSVTNRLPNSKSCIAILVIR